MTVPYTLHVIYQSHYYSICYLHIDVRVRVYLVIPCFKVRLIIDVCYFCLFFFNIGNQLVAGHTSDFVYSVLEATARANPSLGQLDELSLCF